MRSEVAPKSRYRFGEFLNSHGLTGIGVEVGSCEGMFACDLLYTWTGDKLYMVDAWRHLEFWKDALSVGRDESLHRMLNAAARVYKFQSRAVLIRDLSVEASKLFRDGTLDFVYIDANHSYEAVSEDLQWWWPKVKSGGILAGHDYIDGEHSSGHVFGVKRAVDEMAKAVDRTVRTIPDEDPSWLIFK